MAKKGLGKGLSALIPSSINPEMTTTIETENNNGNTATRVVEIAVEQIEPNKYQPRKVFNADGLEELALSIKEHGVVQPVVVRKIEEDKYQLVAGERRWRACKLAGLETIPAIIKGYSEQETTEIALIENIQREDLNPLEEAAAYKVLIEEFGLTQEELSKKVGKSRPYIANSLRLLNLPEQIKEMVANGSISAGHGRALLSLPEAGQLRLAEKIQKEGLTVRETEALVKSIGILGSQQQNKKKGNTGKKDLSPEIIDIEEKLRHYFGTKVRLLNNNNGGKIEIEYYSVEELNRILDLLSIS
ncbi:ParB/RepB/Spo0J family partition protein [Zhaonella formicivorans]|uniref:ParB/RepB/Spo0J family partition protein n=1 Tax=Zhaonella formicivorans TaxID=2528593 RepID=UPI0010E762E8|nr:ParB/RepB/Spo0J family partition protein [Zhaonella formicivorans]